MLRENSRVVSSRSSLISQAIARARIDAVVKIDLAADDLVSALLRISEDEVVCILDSGGVRHLGSHLLVAGVRPVEVLELATDDPNTTLSVLDQKLSGNDAAIFTLSYEFGARLQGLSVHGVQEASREPDAFLALFDCLVIHDYELSETYLTGDSAKFAEVSDLLVGRAETFLPRHLPALPETVNVESSFTKAEYVAAVETIQEHIRRGDTYQTNLTQQLRCELPADTPPQQMFWRLRRDHPAPFAAFLTRNSSTVVSASPERFFRVTPDGSIESSPIKGTRRRGKNAKEDSELRAELESSGKDRAENTMIVDLVRNDLGRVCEYGTVCVEKLCDIEEHPTLFHLVSTVRGKLRPGVRFSEILRAVFPCGSITGAPKIRTIKIIHEIEAVNRGLSMGAIGCYFPDWASQAADSIFDLSVAIRTTVVRSGEAVFNVGGGVVIDSDPEKEYEESLLKAAALMNSFGGEIKEAS
jgi:para-aminobenzoate synthetase component I